MLDELAHRCGPEPLIELVTSGHLELSYLSNGLGVKTEETGTQHELHAPATYQIVGHSEMQDVLPRVFERVTGKKGRGRRFANRLRAHVRELRFPEDILVSARRDYLDEAYMSRGAEQILKHLAPSYSRPAELSFRVSTAGERLIVTSNINFAAATQSHEAMFGPGTAGLTPAFVLSAVLNATGDLYLASLYSMELATDPLSRALIESKCHELVVGRDWRAGQILHFQELILKQATAIREAINSGERSVADLLRLLESAERFRDWLQKQEPDLDVVASYYRSVTEGTWAEKLPAKALRWAVAVGAGIGVGGLGTEGIAISASIGAIDMFLLERLARGWRPNQFVEGKLRPFIRAEER